MNTASFELRHRQYIDAFALDFACYRHRVTGAKHYHLACDDTNNAFMIAFPTIPVDSSGIAHILEHTALCGSRKFPVRDPFFMMLRRSLSTFMNAFTSSDHTVFPFATENRQDFRNLLAVYLDATFFPELDPLDFAQEGWRLEFEQGDDDKILSIKGVVYNEMKGAMSAPSTQLWQHLSAALFTDTVYRFNSGGDPNEILSLSHRALRAFHKQYYHPSHAILMTYGSFPAHEHQEQFETEALAHFAARETNHHRRRQTRFRAPQQHRHPYAVDAHDTQQATHVVWGWLLGDSCEPRGLLEGHLLASVLLEHSASPLRHYLETSDLAAAPSELCGLDDSGREMVFCCGVEGSDPDQVDALDAGLRQILASAAADGVTQETLEGIVDRMEMGLREIGGAYPYGLQLMGRILPAALYGGEPVGLLDLNAELTELRRRVRRPSYIRDLIATHLIDNPHHTRVEMYPDPSTNAQEARALVSRLATIRESLSAADRAHIREVSAALEARQYEPQNADVLPRLSLSEVPAERAAINGTQEVYGPGKVHRYTAATNGLLYQQLVLDLPSLDRHAIDHLPLFCEYLSELGVGTETYLQTQSRRALVGDHAAYAAARLDVDKPDVVNGHFVVAVKGLAVKHDELSSNLFELIDKTRFNDSARIKDLLAQTRVDAQAAINDRGHSLAIRGAARSLSPSAWLDDIWDGPTSIAKIQHTESACRSKASALDELIAIFEQIQKSLLTVPWRILLVGEQRAIADAYESMSIPASLTSVRATAEFCVDEHHTATAPPTAWTSNGQVNHCAQAFATVPEGHADAPALAVLARYVQDGFLHTAIREQGGAYGAGAQYDVDSATFRFYSYRDPRLAATFEDFARVVDWLRTTTHDERVDEAILGVIRGIDNPKSPAGAAMQAFFDQHNGRSRAMQTRFREAVLSTHHTDLVDVAERYLTAGPGCPAVVAASANSAALTTLGFEVVPL